MAKTEELLEVYQRPYDPLCPVVCIDETNKQLIEETRIPCEPGHPKKVDSVYVRVADNLVNKCKEDNLDGIFIAAAD